MLCRRWCLGCGRARAYVCFDHLGGQYIKHTVRSTHFKMLRITVAYLNATINVEPETRNQRLEPKGLFKPSKSRGLTWTGLGLACQESVSRVCGRVWNRTYLVSQSTFQLLVGHQDLFPTLVLPHYPIQHDTNITTKPWCNPRICKLCATMASI